MASACICMAVHASMPHMLMSYREIQRQRNDSKDGVLGSVEPRLQEMDRALCSLVTMLEKCSGELLARLDHQRMIG